MRLYFVRHGESEANLLSEFSNTGWKHPLTERGKAQVEDLAGKLAGEGIIAVYSSPLRRAVESAEILAGKLNVPFYPSPALLEYSLGIYEGRSDKEGWDRYWEVIDEWFERGNFDARLEGGESFNDMAARFVPLIEELKPRYGETDGGIVLVGHGGTYRCVLPLVLANIDLAFSREHTLDHTSYVLTDLRGDDLVCLRWAEQVFTESAEGNTSGRAAKAGTARKDAGSPDKAMSFVASPEGIPEAESGATPRAQSYGNDLH